MCDCDLRLLYKATTKLLAHDVKKRDPQKWT